MPNEDGSQKNEKISATASEELFTVAARTRDVSEASLVEIRQASKVSKILIVLVSITLVLSFVAAGLSIFSLTNTARTPFSGDMSNFEMPSDMPGGGGEGTSTESA